MLMSVLPLLVPLLCTQGDIRKDEVVQFYPTLAWRTADGGTWVIEIHGWIYKPEHQWAAKLLRSVFHDDLVDGEAGAKLATQRVNPFFFDSKRGRRVEIELGGRTYLL